VTGLRDRKKQQLRRRIIESAAHLFSKNGLAATTVDDIAAAAEVSPGTVYNYFGTKNALFLAGIEDDTDAMVAQGNAVLERPGTNSVRAVQRLMGVYLEHLLSWEPDLLREVMAASFERTSGEEITAGLARMDQRLIDQLTSLIAGLQERGKVRADVAPAEATLLLFSTMVTQLFVLLAMSGSDEGAVRAQLNRQIEIAFGGLLAASNPDKDR